MYAYCKKKVFKENKEDYKEEKINSFCLLIFNKIITFNSLLQSSKILSAFLFAYLDLFILMGNRWGNSGNSSDFILGGSKITADGDCSYEIKRLLLLGRKVMTNLAYSKAETLLCQQRYVQSRLWFFQQSCMGVRVGL